MNKTEMTKALNNILNNSSYSYPINGAWFSFTKVQNVFIIFLEDTDQDGFTDNRYIMTISEELKGNWYNQLSKIAEDYKEN